MTARVDDEVKRARPDGRPSAAAQSSLGLRGFLTALARAGPGRLAWVIFIQAAAGLGQAVGVLLLVPLLGAIGVSASSGLSAWTRSAFESVGLRPTLTAVLAVYVVVSAATAALTGYQSILSTRYRLEFVDRLRGRLYAAVARAQWRHLMTLRQSDILAVLTTNVSWVGQGALAVLTIVASLIVVGAQLAAAIRVSPAMTGLAILVGVVLVTVVWPLVRRSRRLGHEMINRTSGVLGLTTGFLDGLKLTKAYGREDSEVEAFTRALTGARESQIQFARASAIAYAVQATLTALLLAVVVDVAVNGLQVPIGSLLVVAFVFTRVVSQLTSAQAYIQQLAQALPAFDEVVQLIADCEGAEEASASVRQGLARVGIGEGIELREVHFSYPQATAGDRAEALGGVSLQIPRGSMVALAGPSGAGKTTVADLVAGLMTPTEGQVIVDCASLDRERMLAWRGSVALVPQDPFLFHDTIRANLLWARPEAGEREVWEALEAAAAAGFVKQLPGRLDTVVGDRGMRLSGGERQRLALARALLRAPDLLILDEATSSLDTENERAIRQALKEMHGRTTMLVIAHRLSTASEADEIVVLDSGRVVERGTWSELTQVPAGRLQALIEAGSTPSLTPP